MDSTEEIAFCPSGCRRPSPTSRRSGSMAGPQSPLGGPPTLLDLLTGRPATRGLIEHEAWAVLCQAVQALQDLFLSDGISCKQCLPLVMPATMELSSRGRVRLRLLGAAVAPEQRRAQGAGYLAPEYRSGRKYTDTDTEKMWIFSLGETLKRATMTSGLSSELCQVVADMTRTHVSSRASLMHLLDVISDYCRRRQMGRPFSHVVMDLHQEAMAAVEAAQEEAGGPPAMPHLQLRTTRTSRCDTLLDHLPATNSISRRWVAGLQQSSAPLSTSRIGQFQREGRNTREAGTCTMDDMMGTVQWRRTQQSTTNRPKSICVPPGGYEQWDTLTPTKEDRMWDEPKRCTDDITERPCTPPLPSTHRPALLRRRRKGAAVQRAASRLYRANAAPPTVGRSDEDANDRCVGPEFVVRASLPAKRVVLDSHGRTAKTVTVILLDGQRVEVTCDVERTTAGQLFEAIVQREHLEDNFMLGLSALIAGDFVFLPTDTRLSKAFSATGGSRSAAPPPLLLFVRVRFFLPKGSDRSSYAQHALYLQVRRSLLEHQLPCPFRKIIELAGLALQAEFGDFNEKEHGPKDYFLLEHYIPETMSCVTQDTSRLKRELIDTHVSKKGLSREKAEQDFVSVAQTLNHYGGHFYTATWVLKDNSNHHPTYSEHRPVWLRVSAQGIGLFERGSATTSAPGGPAAYAQFEWRAIRTLCYSKRYLCILPHRDGMDADLLKKYKLKMEHNKSYFAFRLASLHHQFFLRLRTEYDSLRALSRQFGVPLKNIKDGANSLRRMQDVAAYHRNARCEDDSGDGTVNAGTEFNINYRTPTKHDGLKNVLLLSKNVDDCKVFHDSVNEDKQNKENEKPSQEDYYFIQSFRNNVIGPVPDRRPHYQHYRGPKMGVSAVWGGRDSLEVGGGTGVLRTVKSAEAITGIHNTMDNDEEEPLLGLSRCSSATTARMVADEENGAFVLACTSPTLTTNDDTENRDAYNTPLRPFDFRLDESLGDSLLGRLRDTSFAAERRLVAVRLPRKGGGLGVRIAAGGDGGVYIAAAIISEVDGAKDIGAGDQVVAVNGMSLLDVPYERAVRLLQEASGNEVELVVATERPSVITEDTCSEGGCSSKTVGSSRSSAREKHLTENCRDSDNTTKHTRCTVPTTPSSSSSSVPYHKHIRYEIEPLEAIYVTGQGVTGSNASHTSPHHALPLTRLLSKSCSYLSNGTSYDNERTTAVVVDMIRKRDAEDEHHSLALDNRRAEGINKVALPRALGIGRRWRGPVRYPVTPVRKAVWTEDEDSEHFHDGLCEYSASSEDEQVFI